MNSHGAGYGWVFYLGDGTANVGAGVSTASLVRTGRNLKDFYDRFLEEPQLAAWLEKATPEGPPTSWSLKMGMWGAKRYGQGLMAVGDAGSMIHPVSGEGVGYALESDRLAASWAHEANVRQDFSASVLSGYDRQLRHRRAREHLSDPYFTLHAAAQYDYRRQYWPNPYLRGRDQLYRLTTREQEELREMRLALRPPTHQVGEGDR
jgi:flavin-dependent dehydrogenase